MNKFLAAAIAGVVLGVLCTIPILSWFFFFWAIGAGGTATYFYIKNSATRVPISGGLMVGGVTGLVGCIVTSVLSLLLASAKGYETLAKDLGMDPGNLLFDPDFKSKVTARLMAALFITDVLVLILAIVGGLIAVPLFEKRKANVAPTTPESA
jgi:hypothetical protein